MFSGNSRRNHRALGLRGYALELPGRNSRRSRYDRVDGITRGGFGDFWPSASGRHDRLVGRNGEEFGWGREGRVRLEQPLFLRGQVDAMGGLVGGLSSLHLDREASSSGPQSAYFDRRPLPLRRRLGQLDDTLMGRHPVPFSRHVPDMLLGRGHRGRRPYMSGALSIPDFGPGSSADSLDSVSEYSLHRLDRLSKPYHYQPPYAEDYESDIEEEVLTPEEESAGELIYGLPRRVFFHLPRDTTPELFRPEKGLSSTMPSELIPARNL
jgi:hypothetical protein